MLVLSVEGAGEEKKISPLFRPPSPPMVLAWWAPLTR
jgi:hypothetical protein